MTPLRELL
jgi:hypothetical protein